MSDKENKEIITAHTHPKDALLRELAKIPVNLGFKGTPQGEFPIKEPKLSLEETLRLKIMMQESAEDIEAVLDELLSNTVKLASGFGREDILKLLEEKYQLKARNKLRPNNP